MKCPFCGHPEQKVLDSRPAREGEAIRRRRECLACARRFTTFEAPERPRLLVVKRDGTREEFSREKVLNSMLIACRKRPVSLEQVRNAAELIELEVGRDYEDEAPSKVIGERVMAHLFGIDQVAYIRFASVYREFQTVTDFREIVDRVWPAEGSRSESLPLWADTSIEDRAKPDAIAMSDPTSRSR